MRTKLLIAVVLVLAAAVVVGTRQALGPGARATLGNQTTYITAPLAADGLPNYLLAIDQQLQEGVTAENNAAVVFWAAMGPANLSLEDYQRVCARLGVPVDRARRHLVEAGSKATRERLAGWIAATSTPAADRPGGADAAAYAEATLDPAEDPEVSELVDRYLDVAQNAAWTADEIPPLAAWVAENEQPLDLLVEAAARPRFYSPSPTVLTAPESSVVEMLLPHAQSAREAVRSLAVRANYRIGASQFDQAWEDCLACWRWGALAAQGSSLIEKLVGFGIRRIAGQSTLRLLQRDDLPPALAQRILADLSGLPEDLDLRHALDNTDRLSMLDSMLRLSTGRLGGPTKQFTDGDAASISLALSKTIDIDIPLRMANERYDRLAALASIGDWRERSAAVAEFKAEIEAIAAGIKPWMWGAMLLGQRRRSEVVGDIVLTLMLPAATAVFAAEERDQTNLALLRVAAGLALYRQRHGQYPASLDELRPAILPTLPLDRYVNAPLRYERRGDGYLLYSVGANRVDDGGDDPEGRIVDGEWTDGEPMAPGPDAADLVIRLPLPPLEEVLRLNGDRSTPTEGMAP